MPYIEKFKKIYYNKYHIALTDELASEYFERLLTLYKVVYGLLPEVDIEERKCTMS